MIVYESYGESNLHYNMITISLRFSSVLQLIFPRFGIICQLTYNRVDQFMFLYRDSKIFLNVHLTELADVIWSIEHTASTDLWRYINDALFIIE